LEPNTKYTYTISVKTHDGSESKTSQPIVALTKPILEPISFVQAISNLPRQIKILWRPHSSERVESYIIEKTTPSTSQWKLLKKLKGRLQVEYIDKNLKDSEVYVYRVKAVTYDKLISQPSQIVRAQTKALPKSIKNLKATQNLPRKIKITWEPSDTMDVVAYKVYRNASEQGKYDFVTMISADTLSYDDLINDDGKAMFYKITSVDSDALETSLDTNSVMGRTLGQPAKPIIKLGLIQDNKAILNWEQGDKRTTSYIVYKTIKEGMFSSKVIKYENIQDLRFEDSDITRGVEYKYCVQAVDEFGLLSDKTDQILLTLPKLTSLK
jgi:fibronectin type 3 domain-containing protein